MEVVNYNDVFRRFVFEKLKVAKENKDEIEINSIVNDLYSSISNNKYYISVMYLTSYIINYFAYEIYPNDENLISSTGFLSSVKSIDELMCTMNKEIFRMLCDDVFLFSASDYYVRKKTIMWFLNNSSNLIKIAPAFINDIIKYSNKYTPLVIVDEYNRIKQDGTDENVAKEDTICFVTDFLIELEKNDIDNYKEFMHNMLSSYYAYNKYLLSKHEKLDEYALDIMQMIENDINNLILYTANNSVLLEPIVRDYLSFMLLSDSEKSEVKKTYNKQMYKKYENRNVVYNYNSVLRKKLYEIFGNLDVIYDEDVDYYSSKLGYVKNGNIFDDVVKVLYLDNISLLYYDYFSCPNDEELIGEYEFFKELKSLDEYKQYLLEDDFNLLYAISSSIYFYNHSIIEKKSIINTLYKEGAYDNFLINNYLSDVIEFSRKYDLSDAVKIYYDLLLEYDDKKSAINVATSQLEADLLDIELYDENEFFDLIYDISKKFYEYNKYLYDNNVKLNKGIIKIIKMMENNLDDFLLQVKNNDKIKERLIFSFYEYVSCDTEKKQNVSSYFEKLEASGKVKVFNKKNKNSN